MSPKEVSNIRHRASKGELRDETAEWMHAWHHRDDDQSPPRDVRYEKL
jgi:hypothetical protein